MPAPVTVTAASPAVVSHASHPYATGQCLHFDFTAGGSMPSPMTQGTDYFARWAAAGSYQLSSTNASSQITADATTDAIYWPGHPFSANDAMFFGTNGTIPGGLTASNNNLAVPTYLYAKTIVDAGHFTVSATAGGAQIDITNQGTGTHFATRHVPVNTTTTGSNVVVMGYDPGLTSNAPWVTSTIYLAGQQVTNGGSTYTCLTVHTSGTFSTDLAAGKWLLSPDIIFGDAMVTVNSVALAVNVSLSNIVSGSQVRVSRISDGAELINTIASGSIVGFTTKLPGNALVTIRKSGYVEYNTTITIDGVVGASAYISQVTDGTA